jgi:HD-GYP domain-containing protein (c-di-GMP phosphodiesterase class II)
VLLGTKILTVADAYDAMTSVRPYRKAMTNKAAFAEIKYKH